MSLVKLAGVDTDVEAHNQEMRHRAVMRALKVGLTAALGTGLLRTGMGFADGLNLISSEHKEDKGAKRLEKKRHATINIPVGHNKLSSISNYGSIKLASGEVPPQFDFVKTPNGWEMSPLSRASLKGLLATDPAALPPVDTVNNRGNFFTAPSPIAHPRYVAKYWGGRIPGTIPHKLMPDRATSRSEAAAILRNSKDFAEGVKNLVKNLFAGFKATAPRAIGGDGKRVNWRTGAARDDYRTASEVVGDVISSGINSTARTSANIAGRVYDQTVGPSVSEVSNNIKDAIKNISDKVTEALSNGESSYSSSQKALPVVDRKGAIKDESGVSLYYPLLALATFGSIYGGWFGANKLMKALHKRKVKKEVEKARDSFRKTLYGEKDEKEKTAADRLIDGMAKCAAGESNKLVDIYNKILAAFSDLDIPGTGFKLGRSAPMLTGSVLAGMGLIAAKAGKDAYKEGIKKSPAKVYLDAFKELERRYALQPPTIDVKVVDSPKHGEIVNDEDEEQNSLASLYD